MRKQALYHDSSKAIHNEYLNYKVKLFIPRLRCYRMCDLSHIFMGYIYSLSDMYTPVHSKWQVLLGPKEGNTI